MLNDSLTPRQKKVFKFIRELIETRGYGPTVREIGEEFGIQSPNGVVGHLKALEAKGMITRADRTSRGIQLSDEFKKENRGLPFAGVVSAGALLEAVPQNQRIHFDRLFGRKGTYLLQVTGESMIDAHICDGDYVVVIPRRTASTGDIVVVQTEEGEATLKYWYPEKNRIRLQPANKRMKPIYTRDAKVIGVVVGVVRDFR